MSIEVVLTLASVAMIGAAQVLFKLAARDVTFAGISWHTIASWTTPSMVAALVISAAATALWVWVLRTASLNVVYPLYALAFVAVPLMDSALFGSSLAPRYWVGACAIVGGVWLMSGAHG